MFVGFPEEWFTFWNHQLRWPCSSPRRYELWCMGAAKWLGDD